LHKQKTSDYQITPNLNAASKITLNEKNGKQPALNTYRRSLFSGAKGKTFSVQTADGVVVELILM
jgi:hypothetical protein